MDKDTDWDYVVKLAEEGCTWAVFALALADSGKCSRVGALVMALDALNEVAQTVFSSIPEDTRERMVAAGIKELFFK